MAGEEALKVTTADGRILYVDPSDTRGETLERLGGVVYPKSLELWNRTLGLLDHWGVIADVGANYGEMLVGAAMPGFSRAVAFEPNPMVSQFLRRSLAELPWDCEVLEQAVADNADGDTQLIVDRRWSGTSHIVDVAGPAADSDRFQAITVEKTTLDLAIYREDLDSVCVKIDVEGAESAVLRGASRLLTGVPKVALLIEVLHMPVDDLNDLSKKYPLYLLDLSDGQLARWDGLRSMDLGRALHSGRYWHQDAVLLAGSALGDFDATVRERSRSVSGYLAEVDAEGVDARRQADALAKARSELAGVQSRLEAVTAESVVLAAELSQARSWSSEVAARLDSMTLEHSDLQARFDEQETVLNRSRQELSVSQREFRAARRALVAVERDLTAMHNSVSWRLTEPLREVHRRVRRLRRG